MIGQSNHEALTDSRANAVDRNPCLNNTKDPNQVNKSQVDMHTLEENIVSKVGSEMDRVMTTVETRVQDAVMTAIENLVIPRVELEIKSVNASSGHGLGSFVFDHGHRDSPGSIEGLRMTASSRINSHTDLNRIDETRGNITVEGGDLLVDERNIDQQPPTHHTNQYVAHEFVNHFFDSLS